MLAPFVLNLLIACSLLMLIGWIGDLTARRIGIARRGRSPVMHRPLYRDGYAVYGPSGWSGEWPLEVNHPERN
jgi:hypothetical protein